MAAVPGGTGWAKRTPRPCAGSERLQLSFDFLHEHARFRYRNCLGHGLRIIWTIHYRVTPAPCRKSRVAPPRCLGMVKQTKYFESVGNRQDRVAIVDAWLERAISSPIREYVQADGRIRRWCRVPEMENRVLRVILLEDGETVHNAFFDRNY